MDEDAVARLRAAICEVNALAREAKDGEAPVIAGILTSAAILLELVQDCRSEPDPEEAAQATQVPHRPS